MFVIVIKQTEDKVLEKFFNICNLQKVVEWLVKDQQRTVEIGTLFESHSIFIDIINLNIFLCLCAFLVDTLYTCT